MCVRERKMMDSFELLCRLSRAGSTSARTRMISRYNAIPGGAGRMAVLRRRPAPPFIIHMLMTTTSSNGKGINEIAGKGPRCSETEKG